MAFLSLEWDDSFFASKILVAEKWASHVNNPDRRQTSHTHYKYIKIKKLEFYSNKGLINVRKRKVWSICFNNLAGPRGNLNELDVVDSSENVKNLFIKPFFNLSLS